jgi:hypothetical protein
MAQLAVWDIRLCRSRAAKTVQSWVSATEVVVGGIEMEGVGCVIGELLKKG